MSRISEAPEHLPLHTAPQKSSVGPDPQRRGLLSNLVAMLSSELVNRAGRIAFFFLVAKIIVEEQMGAYSFCITLAAVASVPVGLGMQHIVVRELAKDPKVGWRLVETTLWYRLTGMLVLIGLLTLSTFVVPLLTQLRLPILIASVAIGWLLLQNLGSATFQGIEQMWAVPLINAVAIGVRIVALPLLWVLPRAAVTILCFVLAANVAAAGLSFVLLRRQCGRMPRPHRHPDTLGHLVKQSAPLGLLELTQRANARFDWLFLGFSVGLVTLAGYSVGYSIYQASNMVTPALLLAAFPKLSRASLDDGEVFTHRLMLLAKTVLIFNTWLACVVAFHVDDLLNLAFPNKYAEAALPCAILACGLPLVALSGALYHAFLARGDTWIMLFNGLVVTGSKIALCVVLIPLWGSEGAAWATVIPQSLLLASAYWNYWRRYGPLPLAAPIARCVLACATAVVVGLYLPAHWLLTAVAQTLAFIAVACLIKYYAQRELEQLMSLVRRPRRREP